MESLVEWFQTLNLTAPHSNAEELSDGVAFAQALNQFVPELFTDGWLSKIRNDVGGNWRLKMSNLKKVIEGLYDYYGDVLNYSLTEFARPDAMRIAEKCDVGEMERLLQLVLGCAVNCAAKQDYIRQIMCLEESLQQNIMRALQELESSWQGASLSRNSLSIANLDYKMLQEERDSLAQKCFETEKKLHLMVEEKGNLQQELLKLQKEVERMEISSAAIGDDMVSIGPVQAGSARYNDLRRQHDLLKEELLHSETAREDHKLKTLQQEKEMQQMHQRIDDLTKVTAELTQLKDEIDVLRESNDKLKVCEAQLDTYKKKLEEFNDLKKHVKVLEERSADYVQQNVQFEEDAKKYATIKGQVELFKKEIQELHSKLDNEMSKNDKLEFENKNLENNLSALQRVKDSLLKERDNLRESFDELKCGQLSSNSANVNTMSKELQPTALIEKIQRLEAENKALREGQGGQTALAQLLDDANKRNDHMRELLKSANERILLLSHASQSDDPALKESEFSKQIKQLMELNDQKTLQIEESVAQQISFQGKITQLENTLSSREQELMALDAKYKRCIEKSKEIIKNLDPRIANVLDLNLAEKSHELSGEEHNRPQMSTLEEQLMATAFYRLGVNMQRDAIDSKLALLLGQGQTFLARQRQSAPRKSLTSYKTK